MLGVRFLEEGAAKEEVSRIADERSEQEAGVNAEGREDRFRELEGA